MAVDLITQKYLKDVGGGGGGGAPKVQLTVEPWSILIVNGLNLKINKDCCCCYWNIIFYNFDFQVCFSGKYIQYVNGVYLPTFPKSCVRFSYWKFR